MRALKHAPFRGDLMAQWIYDAFDGMDQRGAGPALPTLMPDRHLLELFVTVTDFYGYERQVPYADPNPIHDMRHRHVLGFRYGGEDGRDDFGADSNGALTFAARATSCIPGVFPPVSFDAADQVARRPSRRPDRARAAVLPQLPAREVPARAGPGSSTEASSTTSRSAPRSRRSGSVPPTSRSTGGSSISSRTRAERPRRPSSRRRARSPPRSAG